MNSGVGCVITAQEVYVNEGEGGEVGSLTGGRIGLKNTKVKEYEISGRNRTCKEGVSG